MNLTHLVIGLPFILSVGCTTPVEIKQALTTKDQAYIENITLMEQYHELVMNITARHNYWYRYVQTRLKLDLALQWATTNPRLRDVPDATLAEDDFFLLGPEITAIINESRLTGLPERKTSDGKVIFAAGTSDMNKLIQNLPDLIARVDQRISFDSQISSSVDKTAFDNYKINVNALRRINTLIKGYLDIDVKVGAEDVQQSAEALQALRR
jgi:hypothetical protein